VQLPRSTVQRIVQALAAEGLLLAGGGTRSIRIGPQIQALALDHRTDVAEIARPHLQRLSEQAGETVDLALLHRDKMVFIDQIAGPHRLRAVSAVGERFPLHCTANGKAVLALLDDTEIMRICAGGMERFTPSTLVTTEDLLRQIRETRRTGFAKDAEEHSIGICAIGMAFRDAAAALYAVSIPMPSVRFVTADSSMTDALRHTVSAICKEMLPAA
jgi:DNA-binding IclR family transcriptional regulator